MDGLDSRWSFLGLEGFSLTQEIGKDGFSIGLGLGLSGLLVWFFRGLVEYVTFGFQWIIRSTIQRLTFFFPLRNLFDFWAKTFDFWALFRGEGYK